MQMQNIKIVLMLRWLFFFQGILSSSDDEGDSYSSDGDEGLVIDSAAQNAEVNQNGHAVDPLAFSGSPNEDRQ